MDTKLYIIIINWNGYVDTEECLVSLIEHVKLPIQIVVVDNGSRNDEGQRLKDEFPNIHLISNESNIGFCGGNNAGIKYSLKQKDCSHIMLLNNDTVVRDNFIDSLLAYARSHPMSAVSPVVLLARTGNIQSTGGKMVYGATINSNAGRTIKQITDLIIKPDFLVGTCILTSRETYELVGLLDERFFAYMEDVDWSWRARQHGIELSVVTSSRVLHKHSMSTATNYKKAYYLARNRFLLMTKYYSGVGCWRRILFGQFTQLINDIRIYRSIAFIQSVVEGWQDGWHFLNEVKQENFSCTVCGNKKHHRLYIVPDRLTRLPGQFSVYQCAQCRVRCIYPPLSEKAMSRYYVDDYEPHAPLRFGWRERLELMTYQWQNKSGFKKKMSVVLQFVIRRGLVALPGQRLLDVGCGNGKFLLIADKLGMVAVGVDKYATTTNDELPPGVTIHKQSIVDPIISNEQFDVITLNHVLEHVPDPSVLLQDLHALLKPGGRIIIQVPNGSSFHSKLFGRFFHGIDAPRHTYIFSKKHILTLLNKTGLSVFDTYFRTPTTTNFLQYSIIYLLEKALYNIGLRRGVRKLVHNTVTTVILWPWAIVLTLMKQGDAIEVYAIKE